MTKKDTIRPHDHLFKNVFEKPQNARAELQHMLAPEHVAAINWSTLKLEHGSYVDDELADQHSDLLFSASARASGERVFVYDVKSADNTLSSGEKRQRIFPSWFSASVKQVQIAT